MIKQINTTEVPKTVRQFKSEENRDRFLNDKFPERNETKTPGFFKSYRCSGLGILGLRVTIYH